VQQGLVKMITFKIRAARAREDDDLIRAAMVNEDND
jgi:hypothetical protein